MANFHAKAQGGKLTFDSKYNRSRFIDYLNKNDNIRLEIRPLVPESGKQRRFYFGAIVPLIAYYQEGMNYENPDDLEKVHNWLKMEFNCDLVSVQGKVHKVGKSTRGELAGFLERVLDWLVENYAPPLEALSVKEYERWRDEISMEYGSPANFLAYLIEIGKLK